MGLSQDAVAITATFDGTGILVFGAVKRDAPAPADPLDVVVTVSGPSQPLVVREAARAFGLWINRASVEVDAAPSFYAVATTAPPPLALSDTEDLRHAVTVPRAVRAIGNDVGNREDFLDALLRIRTAEGRYVLLEGEVELDQGTLFRADVALPADLVEGDYALRVFLTRDGAVVDRLDTVLPVRRVGIERWLHALAMDSPLLYGLLSLSLAVAAGWAASAGFRAIGAR
jgi:uncharacterized protein (TIGR02186 family)